MFNFGEISLKKLEVVHKDLLRNKVFEITPQSFKGMVNVVNDVIEIK